MKYFLLGLLVIGAYKAYSNYQSYPIQLKPSLCHLPENDVDDMKIFSKTWTPKGRDRPVFKGYKWKWGF